MDDAAFAELVKSARKISLESANPELKDAALAFLKRLLKHDWYADGEEPSEDEA